ncbi:MAG: hypothetical protein JRJ29_02715 [Deltaproteobacteria bacterium]|nr:hypothetical protein [Deltaproteobacteria bacterium]
MKRCLFVVIFLHTCFFMHPGFSIADEFLGAPLIPGGKVVHKSHTKLEMKTDLSHDEVLRYYKEALKGLQDIRIRDWKEATYIEDDGKEAWHSITISKHYEGGTRVVISKDSWTWIMGTLVLRYVGVFVVLLFLLIGMSLSGAIISRFANRLERKK